MSSSPTVHKYREDIASFRRETWKSNQNCCLLLLFDFRSRVRSETSFQLKYFVLRRLNMNDLVSRPSFRLLRIRTLVAREAMPSYAKLCQAMLARQN